MEIERHGARYTGDEGVYGRGIWEGGGSGECVRRKR